jgi:transcriptional regulator with XRE-family HTH domain
MSVQRKQRERMGLTQADAAARAGISLATWRRWEEDPAAVRASTRASCERVVNREAAFEEALSREAAKFEKSWSECPFLTPRQAYAIAASLDGWADMYIAEWLREPTGRPLHEVSPLDQLDLRVMMLVNENRAWAAKAQERCRAVSEEIAQGILPFDRPGCFIDELLMALALSDAQDLLADMPDVFEGVTPREDGDDYGDWVLDDDWDVVSDAFDDRCRWDEWEVPLHQAHPLMPAILADRHPYTWFDNVPASGPGYMNRLMGLEVLVDDSSEEEHRGTV